MEEELSCGSEGELIRLAQQGDRDASAKLLDRRRPRLARLVQNAWSRRSRGTPVPAELLDWVQGDLFQKNVLAKFNPDRACLDTFLRTVVRNSVADYFRENAKFRVALKPFELGTDPPALMAPTAASPLEGAEIRERLLTCLRGHPVRQRVVVLLRLFEVLGDELSQEERVEIERASGRPWSQVGLEVQKHVRETPVKGGWSADHRFVARVLGMTAQNAMQIQCRILREVRPQMAGQPW